jgi:hypothetical protein
MTESIADAIEDLEKTPSDHRGASYKKQQDYQERPNMGGNATSMPESRSLKEVYNPDGITGAIHNALTHNATEGAALIAGGVSMAEKSGYVDIEALNTVAQQYPEASAAGLVAAGAVAAYAGADDFGVQDAVSEAVGRVGDLFSNDGFVDLEEEGVLPEDEELEQEVEEMAGDLSDVEFYDSKEDIDSVEHV